MKAQLMFINGYKVIDSFPFNSEAFISVMSIFYSTEVGTQMRNVFFLSTEVGIKIRSIFL